MEALSFVKNFRNGSDWEQAGITEQEEESLQEIIENKNEAVMQRAYEIAEKIIARFTSCSSNVDAITAVACRIYESNRINAQSFFESYINRKIYFLRNGNNNGNRNGNGNRNSANGDDDYE
ncbi:MAG: hypothetical protein ABSF88_09090 [Candidatus Aminicenantales bacterium]